MLNFRRLQKISGAISREVDIIISEIDNPREFNADVRLFNMFIFNPDYIFYINAEQRIRVREILDRYLQDRLRFSLDLKFKGDLDSNSISDELRQELKNKRISFSSSANVLIEKKGTWWLMVYREFLFSASLKFRDDLDNNSIPEDLRQQFENKGILLFHNAAAFVEEKGKRWLIVRGDRTQKYAITKEDGELDIYKEKQYIVREEKGKLNVYQLCRGEWLDVLAKLERRLCKLKSVENRLTEAVACLMAGKPIKKIHSLIVSLMGEDLAIDTGAEKKLERMRKHIGNWPREKLVDKFFSYYFAHLKRISSLFCVGDLKDPASLIVKLQDPKGSLSQYLREQLSRDAQRSLDEYDSSNPPPESLQKTLTDGLNRLLKGKCLYDEYHFAQVELTEETRRLIEQKPSGQGLIHLNRLLLEQAYPDEVAKKGEIDESDPYYRSGSGKAINTSARFE